MKYSFIPFNANFAEEILLTKLGDLLSDENMPLNIEYTRLADGAINLTYNDCQFGRFRLCKKKHWMQILTTNNVKYIYGEVDDFILYLDRWIDYIETLLLNA